MSYIAKTYKKARHFATRCYVKFYREISKFRIIWSLIKLVESFSRLQRASAALTYHTIFAIVPIMSLMIAIAKGLGYDDLFIKQVQSLLQGQEIISDSLLLYANSYLNNSKATMWFGVGIGLLLLLYSVFSIFSTIDTTFNMLWNEKPRNVQKRLKTFAFVLVLPFAVILALALWWSVSSIINDTIVKEINILFISVATYILLLLAAYKLIPNTIVKTKYAAISAVVCGLIFAAMQYFSYAIISSFNYRNIYGDMASLMIFVLLIYFSWTICLAGSKWNYFLQKADEQERENEYKSINHRYMKFLCMLIIERIESMHPFTGHFDTEQLALNAEKEYGLPTHLTQSIIKHLRNKKVLFTGGNDTLRLSKRYSGLTVRELMQSLDYAGRNINVIERLKDIHGNTTLDKLWKVTNGETGDTDNLLDIQVKEILETKQK